MAHILIVNDDLSICRMLREELECEGHTAQIALDGVEGLALLRTASSPLVVLIDNIMPRMDGITMLHAATHDPTLAVPHVFLFTTWRDLSLDDVRQQAKVRPDVPLFRLCGPFQISAFLAVVEEAIQRLAGA